MFVVNGIGCLFNISLCFVFHTLALREELTQKTIAVLIGAPFPWRIWVGEVDLAAFDLGHIRKLRAIVKRDRFKPGKMSVNLILKQPLACACPIVRNLDNYFKASAKELISGLQRRGITPVMLTGDNPKAAEHVANLLGLTEFHAGLLPDDKQKIIADYQAKGNHVIMVGDGVNDAPSLSAADIGIAIGAGTDVAIDSADVVLVKSEPSDILHFLDLAKITNRKMVQNLWWGAGYNIVAIPLAAGVLSFMGITLDPAVGAVAMAMSSIIVAINAIGLTGKKIKNV